MFPFGRVIIICWIIFWSYWLISAFSSKKNSTTNIKRFMGIRLLILVLAVTFYRVFNTQTYSFENRLFGSSNNSVPVLTFGFILFIAGLLLAIWARIYIGKNWGMPMTEKEDPELVTSGPYSYIRHPIYSGVLLAFLGTLMAGNASFLPAIVIAGIYFIYSAKTEEKIMTKQFPKVYPTYKNKTKMLIPFIY
jgi:protein-S-isoprenylcysteine O-methyltransferase Ste14